SVNGQIQFRHADIHYNYFTFTDVNGGVFWNEDFKLLPDKTLRLTYLFDENPFKRVDFTKISPFLDENSSLRIQKIVYKDKAVGPLRANASLEQNLLMLDRLDVQLLDGVLTGQAFVDVYPSAYRLGLNGRLNNINLTQLLPPQ